MSNENVAGYVRVSTKSQADDGQSIPVQKESCGTYVKDNKLGRMRIFDEAASAFQGKRTGYYEMLDFIETNRPGHLVFLLPDRLSRSPEAFEDLIKLCRDIKHNLILHDVYHKRQFGVLDPQAFEELAALRKEVIDAGLASARMRYRVGRSVKRLLEQGFFPGYPPVGYRNIIGARKIVLDEERAPFVVRAFNMYATGDYSVDDVWERMLREGMTVRTPSKAERSMTPCRAISRSDLWRMLKNPFYCGSFRWGQDQNLWSNRGIEEKGEPTYPPLISKEVFDKAQEAADKNRRDRKLRTGKPFLYRGLIECRYCGCQLVGDGNPEGPYTYYHCTSGKAWDNPTWYKTRFGTKKCPQKNWKESEITAAVEKAIADVQFDKQAFEDLRRQITGEIVERRTAAKQDLKGLRKRQTELQAQDDSLWDSHRKGDVKTEDLQNYHRLRSKIKAQLEEISGQIEELEGLDDGFIEEGVQTLEMAQDFLNLFKNKDLKKSASDNLIDHKVLVKTYFRKIVAGDPLKPDPMYEYTWPPKYNGLEFQWAEPFNTLWETKVLDDAAKKASEVYRENRAKWDLKAKSGGADETRTRDLRRDRPAF